MSSAVLNHYLSEQTQIVRDKIESLGVIRNLVVKARQVEAIQDKVLVHFTEIFISLG